MVYKIHLVSELPNMNEFVIVEADNFTVSYNGTNSFITFYNQNKDSDGEIMADDTMVAYFPIEVVKYIEATSKGGKS